jgi:hypothetical protein
MRRVLRPAAARAAIDDTAAVVDCHDAYTQ